MEPKKKTYFQKSRERLPPDVMDKWTKIQQDLRKKIIEYDDFEWTLDKKKPNTLKYIAGMDISFSPSQDDLACSCIVVLDYSDLTVVYQDHDFVQLSEPYIPGFLAFREAPHLLKLVEKLKKEKPQYIPQLILFDGNGVLHNNGCGLASHMGVLLDIPSIGASKTMFFVDGITKAALKDKCRIEFEKGIEKVEIVGKSKRIWGLAVKATKESTDPMIISIGTKISLQTAYEVIQNVSLYRVPEPIRQADKYSRKLIKKNELKLNFN